MARPRGLRQTRLAEASGLHRGGAARPRPPQRLRPSTIELGRGCALLAPPRSPGGRRGEAPAAPARSPRPLPPAALPGPSARYGGWAGPAPALRRGVSRPPTARAAASASRAGAPASHAPPRDPPHHDKRLASRGCGGPALWVRALSRGEPVPAASPPGPVSPRAAAVPAVPRPGTVRCPRCPPPGCHLQQRRTDPGSLLELTMTKMPEKNAVIYIVVSASQDIPRERN